MFKKPIYLDTNVYSRMAKKPSEYALFKNAKDKIECCASALHIQEISLTTDSDLRKKLFYYLKEFSGEWIYHEPNKIIKAEVNYHIKHQKPIPEIPRFVPLWKDIKIRPSDSGYHHYKKEFEKKVKSLGKDIIKQGKKILSFEQLKEALKQKGANVLAALKICFDEDLAKSIHEVVKIDYEKLPSLRYSINYSIELMRRQLYESKNIPPKYGDNVDMQHALYFRDAQIFVTDDAGFFEVADVIKEKSLEVYKYEDFLKYLKWC